MFLAEKLKILIHYRSGQGTIYPDAVESLSLKEGGSNIKSHHNIGGLPETLNLQLSEPLRLLYKDEVRKIGQLLNVPDFIVNRHPFSITWISYTYFRQYYT